MKLTERLKENRQYAYSPSLLPRQKHYLEKKCLIWNGLHCTEKNRLRIIHNWLNAHNWLIDTSVTKLKYVKLRQSHIFFLLIPASISFTGLFLLCLFIVYFFKILIPHFSFLGTPSGLQNQLKTTSLPKCNFAKSSHHTIRRNRTNHMDPGNVCVKSL